MAHIKIEVNRGAGWTVRAEGDEPFTAEHMIEQLPAYCSQYPHRLYIDGKLIAEVVKPRGTKSKVVRH